MGYTSALESIDWRPFEPSTHSDSDQPEADQRRQAGAYHTPGWFDMACSYADGTGGLPPRPGRLRLTRVEQGCVWMNEARQIRREEIRLCTGAAGADLPALRTGFLLDPATRARLGEPRAPGVDQDDGPASKCRQTGQPLDKHYRYFKGIGARVTYSSQAMG